MGWFSKKMQMYSLNIKSNQITFLEDFDVIPTSQIFNFIFLWSELLALLNGHFHDLQRISNNV